MRTPTFTLLSITVVAAALATGCGGDDSDPSVGAAPSAGGSSGTSSSISIKDFKFSPSTTRVPAGARVGVANKDTTAHTVTADDGKSFDTETVNAGASTTFQAPAPGSYAYHCEIHPFMKGTLRVQ
jgi:plastocyanin